LDDGYILVGQLDEDGVRRVLQEKPNLYLNNFFD